MTINGWEISEAGAKQVNVVWGYSAINTRSIWVAGSPLPVLLSPQVGFKPLQIVLSVSGNGRNAIRDNISYILSKMIGTLDIQLDGFLNSFRGTLKTHAVEELSRKRWHKVTLTLEGYEYGEEIAIEGAEEVEVYNPGTAETPVRIEVSSSVALGETTISCAETGWSLTLPGVASGSAAIIDAETGMVTQNGILVPAVFTELPVVTPGTAHFAASNPGADLIVKLKPRYL